MDPRQTHRQPFPPPSLTGLPCRTCPPLQVIGIECSTIIEQARKIVEANGFADKITLIKSKCEDIESLEALTGVDKVCVCVCVFSLGRDGYRLVRRGDVVLC